MTSCAGCCRSTPDRTAGVLCCSSVRWRPCGVFGQPALLTAVFANAFNCAHASGHQPKPDLRPGQESEWGNHNQNDRQFLELPGVQARLIKAVAARARKTVVVMINGGPIASEAWLDDVDALVEAFYPGQLGGDAVVNLLFAVAGKSPSGKLPFTNYRGDFVARSKFQMDLRADGGVTHSFFRGKTNFPFGFGLSYTNFTYTLVPTRAAATAAAPRTAAQHSAAPQTHVVQVANVGDRASQVVVLAFASSGVPGAPLQTLFAFDRVALEAGESKRLRYAASAHDLSTVNDRGERHLLPGNYTIRVGDVVAPAVAELELVGEPVALPKFSATKLKVPAAAHY